MNAQYFKDRLRDKPVIGTTLKQALPQEMRQRGKFVLCNK